MRRSIYQTFTKKRQNIPKLPLDVLAGLPVAAYSVARLANAYSGSAMRVRRSSDNLEQDIGFVNNALDSIALGLFVGSSNGFVSRWYDQSGNARDITNPNPATQPQIVSNGAIIRFNGLPAIQFTRLSASSLTGVGAMPNCNEMSLLMVHVETIRDTSIAFNLSSIPNVRAQAHIPWSDGTVYWDINLAPPTYTDRRTSAAQVAGVGQLKLIELIHSVTNNRLALREGGVDRSSTIASSVTVPNGRITLGDDPIASGGFNGAFSEFILFGRDLSAADRNTLTLNIKTRYNI